VVSAVACVHSTQAGAWQETPNGSKQSERLYWKNVNPRPGIDQLKLRVRTHGAGASLGVVSSLLLRLLSLAPYCFATEAKGCHKLISSVVFFSSTTLYLW